MRAYKDFRPTYNDIPGLGLEDRQEWLVLPCGRNRDSDCLTESNFHVALRALGGESECVEVHRFSHWACGWIDVILVKPNTPAAKEAEEIDCALADYPVLDDEDLSEREQEAANETWTNCFNDKGRVEYIRKHRSQFEFSCWEDMLACVRGNYFSGYPSELLQG